MSFDSSCTEVDQGHFNRIKIGPPGTLPCPSLCWDELQVSTRYVRDEKVAKKRQLSWNLKCERLTEHSDKHTGYITCGQA